MCFFGFEHQLEKDNKEHDKICMWLLCFQHQIEKDEM